MSGNTWKREAIDQLLQDFAQRFPAAYAQEDLSAWVHLIWAKHRPLNRLTETNLSRIPDFKAAYNEATSDRIRLLCLSEAVSTFFSRNLFEDGIAVLERFGDKLSTAEGRSELAVLRDQWQQKVDALRAALAEAQAVRAHQAMEAYLNELVNRRDAALKNGDRRAAQYYDGLVREVSK